MNPPRYVRMIHGLLALVAALFGVVTIIVGTRVLAGSDPGYIVFRPLLLYNTAMGMVYVAAGVIAGRNVDRGKYAAATIFVLNFLVLAAIGYVYAAGGCCCYGKSSRNDLPNCCLAGAVSWNGMGESQEPPLEFRASRPTRQSTRRRAMKPGIGVIPNVSHWRTKESVCSSFDASGEKGIPVEFDRVPG